MPQFIDTHCHFDFSDFDRDRAEQWRLCRSKSIDALIIPGVVPQQWTVAAKLSRTNDNFYYGAGVHPWWLSSGDKPDRLDAQFDQEALARSLADTFADDKCIAIGECGLDKLCGVDWAEQLRAFEWHVSLAAEHLAPLIIHCVRAHNETIQLLKKYRPAAGGVIHAFSGSYEIAREYRAMGFYLGVGGVITFDRAKKTRDAVRRMPLDSLLLETDAPDMPLSGHEGQRNSPTGLIDVAACLANIRSETLETIASATTANAESLFKISL